MSLFGLFKKKKDKSKNKPQDDRYGPNWEPPKRIKPKDKDEEPDLYSVPGVDEVIKKKK